MSATKIKRVLVLCFSELHRDPRVYRQLLFLSSIKDLEIYAAGWTDPKMEGVHYIQLPKKKVSKPGLLWHFIQLKFRKFESFYWTYTTAKDSLHLLQNTSFDILVANDIESLPLAIKLKEGSNMKVVYDAHEYTPKEFENSLKWRFIWKDYKTYLCEKYLKKADKWITVSPSIAKEYKRVFNIDPIVITNAPPYEEIPPIKIEGNVIRIVHHGGATKSRKIENMIKMMSYTNDHYHLHLILIGNPKYQKELRNLAENNKNIHFEEPVPMPRIARELSKYDIGLYILEDHSFNEKYALPNKLFEFIQARLMIAIGPSFEMKEYVKKYNIGIISKDYSPKSMAQALNQLSVEEITSFKANANECAKELSADANYEIFINHVLTGNNTEKLNAK